MLNRIAVFARSFWYWALLVMLGLTMETLALLYQHAWDHDPCELCVHIRIWLLGVIIVAGLGLWIRRISIANTLLHLLTTGLLYGMLHTSQLLLGIERSTIFRGCGISLDLPSWFALDQWFPALFGVWGSCGKTPELLLGITMAEGLTVISWTLLLLNVMLLAALVFGMLQKGR
jgi:disulfide bond formation protein DsbB